MARMKKPEGESSEEADVRHLLEMISNHATRNEKTSWDRKRTNMNKLVRGLRPMEDKIMEIRAKMEPIYDEIAELRIVMVDECIHPFDMLVFNAETQVITCKFCNKSMKPVESARIMESGLET